MHSATRILPLALTLVIGIAPAALARAAQTTTQSTATMTQVVLPGDMTMKGQLEHAYMEALHAHQSLAKGMGDMASNHLSNVEIVISSLEQHSSQIDAATRQRLSQIRSMVSDAKNSLSDRTAGTKATSALVGAFTAFYDQVAARPMGGGGGMARPELSTTEALGMASTATAKAQTAIASRHWDVATLHMRDASKHLDTAYQAAQAGKLSQTEQQHMRTLQKEAQTLNSSIQNHSNNAVKQAGSLVNRIGSELSKIASSQMGGGGGM